MAHGHATLSPSGAERWFNCPGSVEYTKDMPSSPSNVYAAEGTVTHALGESLASGKATPTEVITRIGEVVEQDGFEIPITEEMADAAIAYHDMILRDRTALMMGKGTTPVVAKAEVRVGSPSIDERLWGTADFLLYKKGAAITVYDLKYGKKYVNEERNKQALIYLVSAMETEAGFAFSKAEIVIFQPRAGSDTERRWEVSMAEIHEFRKELKAAADRTRDPNAPLVAGSWCKYCPAETSCPTNFAGIQREAMSDFTKLPVEVPKGTLPDVSRVSMAQLSRALDHEDYINSWFEAAKLRIKSLVEAGDPEALEFWKLVEGKANRVWTSEDAVVTKYGGLLGDQLYVKKLLSPAALEKIVGKKNLDPELWVKPMGSKSIARIDDPRPAVRTTVQEDFEALPAPVGLFGEPVKQNKLWP